MREWRRTHLGALVRHFRGYSYSSTELRDGGEDFISLKVFGKGGGFRVDGVKSIDAFIPDRFRVPAGAVLLANTDLTRDADVVGVSAIVPPEFDGAVISMDATRCVPNPDLLDERFLALALGTPEVRAFMRGSSAGSTVLHLDTRRLDLVPINLPPLVEQRRIAEVLGAVDETIQATERVIAKRRLLRTALMREQVVPCNGANDESPVARDWIDVRIGDALQQRVERVRIDDRQRYDLISIRRRHGGMFHRDSLVGSAILGKNMQRVVPGTFVIARRQIVHGACAIATPEFSDSIMSMSYSAFVGTPICDVRYFFVLAQTPSMARRFWDASHGVVVEKLNFQQEEWLDYRVQLPPLEVQRKVIAALMASEEELAALELELETLRGVRVGLTADLLSGRVRTATS